MAKSKFYVVWEGKKPGIYTSWDACKQQVEGVAQARYKSFESAEEAAKAFRGDYRNYIQKKGPAVKKPATGTWIRESVAVDAACSGNPGDMEYKGVWVADGSVLFSMGPLPDGTNNIGEFLAIVHAMALLKMQGKSGLPIYSDSVTAQGWVKKGKCNTKLAPTKRNAKIFELIDRAEKWLATNKITNPLLKWDTASWGEIPADYGRKG